MGYGMQRGSREYSSAFCGVTFNDILFEVRERQISSLVSQERLENSIILTS